jgi:hypothetical protein
MATPTGTLKSALFRATPDGDRLSNEGYFTHSITGPLLRAQIKDLMQAAQKSRWSSHTSIAGTVAVAKASRARSRRAVRPTAHASSSKTAS